MKISCMNKFKTDLVATPIHSVIVEDFKITLGYNKGYLVQIFHSEKLVESFFSECQIDGIEGLKEATAIILDRVLNQSSELTRLD